jgi:hypothetical protein
MSPPAQQFNNAAFHEGSRTRLLATCGCALSWGRRVALAFFGMVLASLVAAGIVAWQSLNTLISLPIL